MKNLALREWAASRHGEQRYGDEPYVSHLDEVAGVAEEFFPGDEQLQEASYGHDLLEDTDATEQELRDAGFGAEAVKDIAAVSDPKGMTRAEAKKVSLPAIRARGISAIKLKLCDRVANARRGGKLAMYRKEQALLESHLYDESHVELAPIWQHLRELLAA